jgi:hypothetical protein
VETFLKPKHPSLQKPGKHIFLVIPTVRKSDFALKKKKRERERKENPLKP